MRWYSLPRRDVTVRVPAEVVVAQVAQVLDLLLVEDERQLRRVPRQADVAGFAAGKIFKRGQRLSPWHPGTRLRGEVYFGFFWHLKRSINNSNSREAKE